MYPCNLAKHTLVECPATPRPQCHLVAAKLLKVPFTLLQLLQTQENVDRGILERRDSLRAVGRMLQLDLGSDTLILRALEVVQFVEVGISQSGGVDALHAVALLRHHCRVVCGLYAMAAVVMENRRGKRVQLANRFGRCLGAIAYAVEDFWGHLSRR